LLWDLKLIMLYREPAVFLLHFQFEVGFALWISSYQSLNIRVCLFLHLQIWFKVADLLILLLLNVQWSIGYLIAYAASWLCSCCWYFLIRQAHIERCYQLLCLIKIWSFLNSKPIISMLSPLVVLWSIFGGVRVLHYSIYYWMRVCLRLKMLGLCSHKVQELSRSAN